ncbi:MAG TPA: serine hydrolase [Gemmatimonadaceae bacterium]|jgi:CubicO group peptidase (beta-lactamase class C family)
MRSLVLLGLILVPVVVATKQRTVPPARSSPWHLNLATSANESASTNGSFPSDADILAILKQRVEEKRSAGIVVGMLEADGRTHYVAYGDPGPGKLPLDSNTVFETGSISKVFTATLLSELVQDGKVKLDDPVQKYLPSSVHVPSRDGKVITLGLLSEQHSGLPRMPSNFHPANPKNPYADYSVQQMYDFLSGYTLPRDPGQQFEYSNLGVGLLGHALALSQHKPYEDLAREKIWQPLGMTHTAITFTPWMTEHLALGHDEKGNVTSNWDLPTFAGAGAIRSTAADMLKFAAANLHADRGPLERAMSFAQQPRDPLGPGSSIGLNWMLLQHDGDTIVWHNGGTGGYRTFLGLDHASKTAIIVLTNSTGEGADDIGFHLLNAKLPLAPKPAPAKQHTAIELPADSLTKFVGVYALGPQLDLTVTLDNGALYVQPTGQAKLRLWPESASAFFLKEVDVQLSFARDAAGAVTSATLTQSGTSVPVKKIR